MKTSSTAGLDWQYASSTSHDRPHTTAYKREQRMKSEAPPKVRLVLCCDGTGNTPASRTNVRRIWECLLGAKVDGSLPLQDANRFAANVWSTTADEWQTHWPDEYHQICFYQTGINSSLKQKGLGDEIHAKIEEAYRFICDNWTSAEQNEIVLIGFSRGGFACQCLVAFLSMYGVMHLNDETDVRLIYREWLNRQEQDFPNGFQQDASLDTQIAVQNQGTGSGSLPAFARSQRVKVCALFDSVAGMDTKLYRIAGRALGARGDLLTFVHHHLPANVESVYHALSINEHRQAFRPVLWANPLQNQQLVQTWFPGFHSDIGGGASHVTNSIIPDLTLIWMVNHLHQKVKIHISQMLAMCWQQTRTRPKIEDSRTILYWLFRSQSEERFAHLTELANSMPFSTPVHAPVIEAQPEWEDYSTEITEAQWTAAVTRVSQTPETFHWSVVRMQEIIRDKTYSEAFTGLGRQESNGRWYWSSDKRNGKTYWEDLPNWLEGLVGASLH